MEHLPGGLHGAYQRAELAASLGPGAVQAAVSRGQLVRYSRQVVVEPRRTTAFRTRAAAALLRAGPDGVLSSHTALALHGCTAAETAPIHVLVSYQRKLSSRPDVAIHHGCYDEQDVDELDGLRVLALDLALSDVLCRGRSRDAIACADEVLALLPEAERDEFRACTFARITSRPDPRGRKRGEVLLDLATGLAESPPESWTLLTLFDAGLPIPEQQVPVHDIDGHEIYRLDLAWPGLRIAVEYDGYAAHQHKQAGDAARQEDLRRRGWIVIRSDAQDLRDPQRLIAAVRAAFRQRGAAA